MAPPVRQAAAREMVNPDHDPAFHTTYEAVSGKLAAVYDSDHEVVVLGGEGILGLEAAIASVVTPGDEVVCLANGPYGESFAEFVADRGGKPIIVESAADESLDLDGLDRMLRDHDPVAATMVHCETPTGRLNDLEPALNRLDGTGVLAVVDAVSSLGGTAVPAERADICLGASQKCLSAPPGLATAAVSEAAWDRIETVDPDGLYTNLLPWRETSGGFPYTHLSTLVAALDEALDLWVDEGVASAHGRHERAAASCRERGDDLGLDLVVGAEHASPTVTAFHTPGRAADLQRALREDHDIVVATGVGDAEDDVLRIGHMGYCADVRRVERTMDALETVV